MYYNQHLEETRKCAEGNKSLSLELLQLYSRFAPVCPDTEVISVICEDMTGSVLCLGSKPRGVR